MKSTVKRFIGKVLPDGHLSLPDETAKEVGSVFDVFLMPVEDPEIYSFAESLAREKGFISLIFGSSITAHFHLYSHFHPVAFIILSKTL